MDRKDSILISYADSIIENDKPPLQTLSHFLHQHVSQTINSLHILPFFPFSSDDGFAVIDFKEVKPELGDKDDIQAIANDYRLMSDLVVNHCSSEHRWFKNFLQNTAPGKDYFYTIDIEQIYRKSFAPELLRCFKQLKPPTAPNMFGAHLAMIKLILIFVIPNY